LFSKIRTPAIGETKMESLHAHTHTHTHNKLWQEFNAINN